MALSGRACQARQCEDDALSSPPDDLLYVIAACVAAAMVGFAHVLAALDTHRTHAVCNLRTLNPHLISILGSLPPSAKTPLFPRQASASPAAAAEDACHGLSSFAFQGTNAHAVISQAAASQLALPSQELTPPWHNSRFWYMPQVRTLLQQASMSPALNAQQLEVRFSIVTASSSLAYLMDHQIKGRVLLPGAAMFEMAASAAGTLLDSSAQQQADMALLNITLHAPLVLEQHANVILSCSVVSVTGRLSVRSVDQQGSGSQRVHASATAGMPCSHGLPMCI